MPAALRQPLFVDAELAARLEACEGQSNANFVEARRRTAPEAEPAWMRMAGGYVMYDGADSPLTQTFGLGCHEPLSESQLDDIEAFYGQRGSAVNHELCPLAGVDVYQLMSTRGYQPIEFTNVLCREIGGEAANAASGPFNSAIAVRVIDESEAEMWAQTSAQGWSAYPEFTDYITGIGRNMVLTSSAVAMVAELDGTPIATAVLHLIDGIALLAGASTIPTARRRGAQGALLAARLKYAEEQGCRLAMMSALPGSDSQRNAQRNGFQVGYTRTKWQLS